MEVVKDFTQENDAHALSTCAIEEALGLAIRDGRIREDISLMDSSSDIHATVDARDESITLGRLGRRWWNPIDMFIPPEKEGLNKTLDRFANTTCDTFQGNLLVSNNRTRDVIKQFVGDKFHDVIANLKIALERQSPAYEPELSDIENMGIVDQQTGALIEESGAIIEE